MIHSSSSTELFIEREFKASARHVFKAWTEPEKMMHWLCPKDFIVLFVETDVRIGGVWRSGMRSPDGIEYVMKGVYREISEFDRLSFTHTWEDDMGDGQTPGHDTLVVIDFNEKDGRTTMAFRQSIFMTVEARDGHVGGWTGAFDNLAQFIQE